MTCSRETPLSCLKIQNTFLTFFISSLAYVISDSDKVYLYLEENLTRGIFYGFLIIKPHFINNFNACACDPIHFQDTERALSPLPYAFLICQP